MKARKATNMTSSAQHAAVAAPCTAARVPSLTKSRSVRDVITSMPAHLLA